ncbi:MAG TPA: hypothetical protein PKM65_19580 [Spirochaetota bacterium]|nr:hypothetical protein [Spirochaetota bacterium]HNT12968.1 hypothetical protein [Spirochaetota bacterium]
MAKTFDKSKMLRGKSLGGAALEIENISDETVDAMDDLFANPRKDTVVRAVAAVKRDARLAEGDRRALLDGLRGQFAGLFNFDNCPEDYESLKLESVFLSELTQYSFLLMGQRLMKIRDGELYRADGYADFKAFVTQELKISRSTAYNYIDLVSVFGVQTFGRADAPDPSKLIPLIPILKSDKKGIPGERLKARFIEEAKSKSAREIQDEAKDLKVKYGLAKAPEDVDRMERAFSSLLAAVPEKLTARDKKKIGEYIARLRKLLK